MMGCLLRVLRLTLVRLILAAILFVAVAVMGVAILRLASPVSLEADGASFSTPGELTAGLLLFSWFAVGVLGIHLLIGKAIDAKTLDDLGLERSSLLPQLAAGFGAGAGLMGAVVGIMAWKGWYRAEWTIDSSTLVGVVLVLAMMLAVAAYEEILFRGIGQRILEDGIGTAPALVVTAAAFGLIHIMNPNSSPRAAASIAGTAGLLIGLAYVVTRQLWVPIGLHWAWNFFQGSVFGIPISGMEVPSLAAARVRGPEAWTGGAFGPEAGLLAAVVFVPAILVLAGIAIRDNQFRSPRWYEERVAREAAEAVTAMRLDPPREG
ncbi:MAG: CPBP family intramembrane metalloprotease [Candidatus Sumerlaeia bacterium]|nr:CPBP family intramembrane metalloprotease [Candidatus Sumerlaeia bacterium]